MRPHLLVEENLRQAMSFYGHALDTGEVRELAGVVVVRSGTDMAMFNPALLAGPVSARPGELDRRIAVPAAHFQAQGVRWSYWVCDDLLDSGLRRQAAQTFAARGMRRVTMVPGMIAEQLRPPVHPQPHLVCRRVGDAATRAAFAHITSVTFDIPYAASRRMYESERGWDRALVGWVGYQDHEPVVTAGTVITRDVVGFYSVGTLPNHRRRGYAEALMRHAYAQVREWRTKCVLQSTAAGERLYEQMGFRRVTNFSIYEIGRA
ncbi:MAG TPA: hypothetical protein DEH78_19225, partial [Solibacterales bacterium]|nr:hypothetical protein [Bryobacterales bacterium]